jgi:hypothetical protein
MELSPGVAALAGAGVLAKQQGGLASAFRVGIETPDAAEFGGLQPGGDRRRLAQQLPSQQQQAGAAQAGDSQKKG